MTLRRPPKCSCIYPSVIEGISRLVDIGGTMNDKYPMRPFKRYYQPNSRLRKNFGYTISGHTTNSVNQVLSGDWNTIASDLSLATKKTIAQYHAKSK